MSYVYPAERIRISFCENCQTLQRYRYQMSLVGNERRRAKYPLMQICSNCGKNKMVKDYNYRFQSMGKYSNAENDSK